MECIQHLGRDSAVCKTLRGLQMFMVPSSYVGGGWRFYWPVDLGGKLLSTGLDKAFPIGLTSWD